MFHKIIKTNFVCIIYLRSFLNSFPFFKTYPLSCFIQLCIPIFSLWYKLSKLFSKTFFPTLFKKNTNTPYTSK